MIPIQNVYYMLAYAFRILRENGYASLGAESFENTGDLLSAILVKGVSIQIKRGFYRDYQQREDILHTPRGKIDISESVKRQGMARQRLFCRYDEFSVDSYPNRIIKTTLTELLRFDIPKTRKKELHRILDYFDGVCTISPAKIDWHLRYNRNNQSYQMLISVCYLILNGLIQTNHDGTLKMMDFLDEQRMCRLYEKFILEYYRKEYPELHAVPLQIKWALDDDYGLMLPAMQTDITLQYHGKMLIIDAKYYSHATQVQYGKHTIHSHNIYQIFTYVKNQAAACQDVSGMLLYAKTDDTVQPKESYRMSGNTIRVNTLDLNCDFNQIKAQLNHIADDFMGE